MRPPVSWDLSWRRRDVLGLLVLASAGAGVLATRANYRPVAEPPAVDAARVAGVHEVRIDPNTASAASLRRLPGIGRKRAYALVAWRQSPQASQPSRAGQVFRSAADLDRVPGLGPKLSAQLAQQLPRSEQPTANSEQ